LPSLFAYGPFDSPAGLVLAFAFAVGVLYVHARLVLTLALVVAGRGSVAVAMRESWRLARGRAVLRVLPTAGGPVDGTVVLAAGIASTGLWPTRFADDRFPEWAPLVAALSLTLVEIALFLLVGGALAVLTHAAMATIHPEGPRPLPDRGAGWLARRV